MSAIIVQQVKTTRKVTDCDGNPITYPFPNAAGGKLPAPPPDFYEAWQVSLDSNGATEIKPSQSLNGQSFNDLNLSPNFGPNTKGTAGYEFELLLFVAPGVKIPGNFKPGVKGGVSASGSIRSTTDPPLGWEAIDVRVLRSINVSWNCCPCQPDTHKTKIVQLNNGTVQRRQDGEIVK
jgi:hypothetical protein